MRNHEHYFFETHETTKTLLGDSENKINRVSQIILSKYHYYWNLGIVANPLAHVFAGPLSPGAA